MRLQEKAAIRTEIKRALRRQFAELTKTSRGSEASLSLFSAMFNLSEETDLVDALYDAWNFVAKNGDADDVIRDNDTCWAINQLITWVQADQQSHLINLWNLQNGTYIRQTYQEHLQELNA